MNMTSFWFSFAFNYVTVALCYLSEILDLASYKLFYKEPVYKEPICRRPKYFKKLTLLKTKFLRNFSI